MPVEEDFGETKLCSRSVEPFLSWLFDDPDKETYLRWTNESTLEAKSMRDSTGRPDVLQYEILRRYGEAKSSARDQDDYLICKDLLKVAVFCNETLDFHLMEGMLGLQIFGRTIKFYLVVVPANGLYGMIELTEIKIPDSLGNLPSLITKSPKL
ncbi:uncharacterized protein BYT42DRAFT_595083 [Radiomyces spectabilis]|uniref:uncharacterized protein n=1 Tax=Radiomyces spectabilis TaxID=64574 RepID=UPI00221EF66D|nr:uncharacterized protein BYT42DRAFT_595083 [Radiomyces spectabilis]KAI8371615.1 hypothetical protein BYT42DRAFT_595083 [Radiomyces spectabilis]